jgi:predicted cupin superfamily sugar epimerase
MVASSKIGSARFWIKALRLSEHPEGGFYRETYRADLTTESCEEVKVKLQNDSTNRKSRSIASIIYYMLEGRQVSLFHRMRHADEIWHFYTGSSLTLYLIEKSSGKLSELKLGDQPQKGELFQILIKRDSWFGARVNDVSSFALVGCTVFPAFSFADFELADRKVLTDIYPEHKDIIKRLTRSK